MNDFGYTYERDCPKHGEPGEPCWGEIKIRGVINGGSEGDILLTACEGHRDCMEDGQWYCRYYPEKAPEDPAMVRDDHDGEDPLRYGKD